MLVRITEAARALGVSTATLRRWEAAGKIAPADHSPGGQRLYDIAEVRGAVRARPRQQYPTDRVTIGYARVSTAGQRADLVRQEQSLEAFCAANGWVFEILRDTGSGMNYHKRGLRALLHRICEGGVERLVITDRDRLLRFGAELVFAVCEQFNTEVVIINAGASSSHEEELAADVLEILAVFSARMYGARSRRDKALLDGLAAAASA
jgi:predicted site-specific integrase-resolvase